ncbi:hypothetical protein [Actinokineospora terrae]|uniref:Uncharacterized protein n=1 Tax=Actinokineospora terrae TaxID=155974 RepID=A0A1H9P1L1_9PSEU|nr:hypothetical protein [Actinokineospora terrae]SER42078.1 hypothetical protein SAMN04487818_103244 [Actinokineospora terrae]
MTLLWIFGGLAVIAALTWRLRRASALVDRMLLEERVGAEHDARMADHALAIEVEQEQELTVDWPHPPRLAWSRPQSRTAAHNRLAG